MNGWHSRITERIARRERKLSLVWWQRNASKNVQIALEYNYKKILTLFLCIITFRLLLFIKFNTKINWKSTTSVRNAYLCCINLLNQRKYNSLWTKNTKTTYWNTSNMEAKEIMSKFDELYGMMASSTNVKYMHTLK